eukprot:scaffold99798_cov27-Tisochrysis_lutea.AAC.3
MSYAHYSLLTSYIDKNLLIFSPHAWPSDVLCYHAFTPLLSLNNLPCGGSPLVRALLSGPGARVVGGVWIWRAAPVLCGEILNSLLFH